MPPAPPITREPSLLFTGFEPSGDDHASAVIEVLRERWPDLAIHAWGGPKMEAAGATVIERTGENAVMGLPGPGKIREHQQINQRIQSWIRENNPTVHIPVDSPAANFPICKIAKAEGLKVVHLVAPQVWAWGSWRIRKLRRLTDRVLCLLPFEETWFRERGVDAEFIGHPLFDEMPSEEQLRLTAGDMPFLDAPANRRLALMPGSRPGELTKNFPMMLQSFRELSRRFTDLHGVIAATTPDVERRLRAEAERLGGMPEKLEVVHGRTDDVIHWSSAAMVVSGTVTLQISRQARPMVIFYKSNPLLYSLIGRWLLTTEFFTLPNLIAGKEIVPEFVPHFAGHEPITEAIAGLLSDDSAMAAQSAELAKVADRFAGLSAATSAADAIERVAGVSRPAASQASEPAPA